MDPADAECHLGQFSADEHEQNWAAMPVERAWSKLQEVMG